MGLAALASLASGPGVARVEACVSCSCGDPTLTSAGVERPLRNRVRVGVEERFGGRQVGGVEPLQSRFLWSTLLGSWAPTRAVTLGLRLPWMSAWLDRAGRPREALQGLGDLTLTGRFVLFSERSFAPRHLLYGTLGLGVPTAPRLHGSNGYPLPDDAQPGAGAVSPTFGLTYAWFGEERLSLFASATARVATPTARGTRRGAEVGASAVLQLQAHRRVALGLGLDWTWTEADRLPNGAAMPHSGGSALYVSPQLLVQPVGELLIRLVASMPTVTQLAGAQALEPQLGLSLVYDVR
jgi:hypothetical protein